MSISPLHQPGITDQIPNVRALASPMSSILDRQWIVGQLGAREHYTVPLGFELLGRLRAFYTDLWCRHGANLLQRIGGRAADVAGRYHAGLPSCKVHSFNSRSIALALRDRRIEGLTARYEHYVREGRAFAESLVRHLARHLQDVHTTAFFTFNTGALEALEFLARCGVPTVVDQIDPARTEEDLLHEEYARWPGWQTAVARIPDCYRERISAEWRQADVVLVNSQWSRNALLDQGVPDSKIAVAPVAYSPSVSHPPKQSPATRPLRVLWLGNVILRKGIQYLLEAARLLQGERVEFRIVGGIAISPTAVASAPANVSFEGRLPRLETSRAYDWADLFVLPTLSDGFAITQLEAMAHGLPVIATPNCGEVVEDGKNGCIVPAGDAQALAQAILRFAHNRDFLEAASRNALARVLDFSVMKVAELRLNAIAAALKRCGQAI